MAEGTFYTYLFEKNLQGDIIAVYNTSGTKLISYYYDAWGNFVKTTHNISGTNVGAQYNPFTYVDITTIPSWISTISNQDIMTLRLVGL